MRRGIERLDPFGGSAEPVWCGPPPGRRDPLEELRSRIGDLGLDAEDAQDLVARIDRIRRDGGLEPAS